MGLNTGYRVAFANLLLSVAQEAGRWTARISDLRERETLFETTARTVLDAKTEAVDFALRQLFGTGHGKDSRHFAETLAWESV